MKGILVALIMVLSLASSQAWAAKVQDVPPTPIDFGGEHVYVRVNMSYLYLRCDQVIKDDLIDFVQRHNGQVDVKSFGYARNYQGTIADFTVARVNRKDTLGSVALGTISKSLRVSADYKSVQVKITLKVSRDGILIQPPLEASGKDGTFTRTSGRARQGWISYANAAVRQYSDPQRAEYNAFTEALDNLVNSKLSAGAGKMIGVVSVERFGVILNVGTADGVQINDRYTILGLPMTDPFSGKPLDRPIKATVKVITVSRETSTCEVVNGDGSSITRGDLAEKIQ